MWRNHLRRLVRKVQDAPRIGNLWLGFPDSSSLLNLFVDMSGYSYTAEESRKYTISAHLPVHITRSPNGHHTHRTPREEKQQCGSTVPRRNKSTSYLQNYPA